MKTARATVPGLLAGLLLAACAPGTPAEMARDAGGDAPPKPGADRHCLITPGAAWQPDWSSPVPHALSAAVVATNRAGTRIVVLTVKQLDQRTTLASYDETGAELWAQPLGTWARGTAKLSLASDDSIYLLVAGKLDTRGGVLESRGDVGGNALFKFDPGGAPVWNEFLVDSAWEPAPGRPDIGLQNADLTVTADGLVWAADTVYSSDSTRTDSGTMRVTVEAHDPGDGHRLFERHALAKAPERLRWPIFLAPALGGGVFLAAASSGAIDVGGGVLTPAGLPDAANLLLARLDAGGAHVWSRLFGDRHGASPRGLATDSLGGLVIGGTFDQVIDFDGKLIGAPRVGSGFAARLGEDGTADWARSFGDEDFGGYLDFLGTDDRQGTFVRVSSTHLSLADGTQVDVSLTWAVVALDSHGAARAARCLTIDAFHPAVDGQGRLYTVLPVDGDTRQALQRLPAF